MPPDSQQVHRLPVGDQAEPDDENPLSRLVPHLHWQVSYDLASVDRFLAEMDTERAAIESQIEQAAERVRDAKQVAARRAEAEAELGARILAAQEEFEAIQREEREAVAAMGASADAEAERLLAAARDEAGALRSATTIAERHESADEPRR